MSTETDEKVDLRQLDAEVAEKVMGLRVRFEKGEPCAWKGSQSGEWGTGEPFMWSVNDYIILKEDGTPEHAYYLHGHRHSYRIVPPYSKEMWAAFEMEERIKELGLQDSYAKALLYFVSKPRESRDWSLAHASALDRCRAALKTIEQHSSVASDSKL
jgi:hypothetical protein